MRYIGIDIGKEKNHVCILDEQQEQIGSFEFKHTVEDYTRIINLIDAGSRIVIEPTGVYSLNLFYFFRNKDLNIRFCDTRSSNHTLRSDTVGIKKKTDKQDAKGLALHSIIHWKKCRETLPLLVKVRGYENTLFYLRLKELLEEYYLFRREGIKVKNKLECLMSLRFPELNYVIKKRNSKIAHKFMCLEKEDYSFPAEEIARFLKVRSNHVDKVVELKKAWNQSLARQTGLFDVKVTETKQLYRELTILEQEKQTREERLRSFIETTEFKRLYDFKGLGTVGIATIITEIRDIKRFFLFNQDNSLNLTKSLKSFRRFCGFVITSNQSGSKQGRGTLVKGCNTKLRDILYMVAMMYSSLPYDNDIKAYYEEKCKRMVKKKALLKTANHLAGKVFHLVKDMNWNVIDGESGTICPGGV